MATLRFDYSNIKAILPMEHEERDKKYFEDEMNSKLETFIDRINAEGGYIKVLTSNNERLFHKWHIEGISNQLRRAIGLD
ncbi:MAG: hypothetical protein IPH34_08810 [Chitinophagaceae bacterium]|nr:hypothetical protein [Chitinophagaceae bacterium]MBK8310440.1 hypothetical protein [Chitinophagaceae bacterium]HQX97534.1 hypothetical protein [Chitinophagaceae bacterium]